MCARCAVVCWLGGTVLLPGRAAAERRGWASLGVLSSEPAWWELRMHGFLQEGWPLYARQAQRGRRAALTMQ